MKRILCAVLLCLASTTIQAKSGISFGCTIANGETLIGYARNGDIVLDFNNKGNWNKAFGKVEGSMVIITEIVAAGRFILAWNTKSNEAYVITQHNRTGEKVENHAFCYWR